MKRTMIVALAAPGAGCSGVQSALDPKGPAADALAQLTWVMVWGATAIFVIVMALAGYAFFRNPDRRRRIAPMRLIIAGGVAFPVVVLSALLVYGVSVMGHLRADPAPEALAIRVIAHQFWWEVLYPGSAAGEHVATANELRIPAGRRVTLTLTSRDVIHSFWVPSLAGKIDLIPGRDTHLTLQAHQAATFRGQCAEFCGAGHSHMALDVAALTDEAFTRWLDNLRAPARSPVDARARDGQRAFAAQGCVDCHAVRGASTPRLAAPDLTHLATRRWLGAGTLENSRAHLIEWIARGELHKPGRRMPAYGHLDAATLTALADYLGTLE